MFKFRIKILLSLLCLVANTLASQTPLITKERLVVKLINENVTLSSDLIKSSKVLFNGYVVVYSDDIFSLKAELETNLIVESVNFDYRSGPSILPVPRETSALERNLNESASGFNDPGLNKLWAFNADNRNGMNVSEAYDFMGQNTGSEVIVAVVDTGVDYNHEDLKSVMWVNRGEIAGNGIDDDQNGYIDDIHGINTLSRNSSGEATGDIMDRHSHGTHVSGTIAAKQNNGIGIAGIAQNARIMGIRTVPSSGDETDVDVAESFLYAAKNGAKIINCSFGKSDNERGMLVKETIDFIGKEYGVLVVAAAGNDSSNIDKYFTYPASFESENLLVVASTTRYGSLSGFSNYGVSNVDVAAPGSSIYSTTPGNRYSSMSGTSMASPNTAGAAAQILSLNPSLSPLELKERIMSTSSKVGKYSSKVGSSGLVNLLEAIR